ncbi:hypothetical protein GALMADRAFT_139800 [Galerina marginata CBS 339.88]|uniref:Uncharacterized protein n=1 Tax=Galerina marginata (strain CBS 339.88) TaxID=685588 RepID=A0A067SYV0_GALM3|nr:hypothetical protein GALMADRAFT_139800 [Galerina marginata CBS 339.88]
MSMGLLHHFCVFDNLGCDQMDHHEALPRQHKHPHPRRLSPPRPQSTEGRILNRKLKTQPSLATSQPPHVNDVDGAAVDAPNQGGIHPGGNDLPQRPLTPPHDRPSCPPSAPPTPLSPKPALPVAGAGTPPLNLSTQAAELPSSSSNRLLSAQPGIKYGHPRRPRNPANQSSSAPVGSSHKDVQSKSPGHKRQAEDGEDVGSKRRQLSDKENKGSKKRKDVPDKGFPSKQLRTSTSIPSTLTSTPLSSTSNSLTLTSATEFVLPLPPSLPKDCQDLIKQTSLGVQWDRLVNLWLRFEGSYKFKGSSKLTATSRPPRFQTGFDMLIFQHSPPQLIPANLVPSFGPGGLSFNLIGGKSRQIRLQDLHWGAGTPSTSLAQTAGPASLGLCFF